MAAFESTLWSPGVVIAGVSGKAEYRVERKLGEGANGQVYLVTASRNSTRYALKIGNAGTRFQSEIALLKKLSPRTGQDRPFFIGSDILIENGMKRPFYVMTYIQGSSLSSYIEQNRQERLYLAGYQLLRKLWANNHRKGFAFGDIKPSNIIVSTNGDIDLIDYGGSTRFGEYVRQFTEIYDREYWNCGTRRADAGYDLFSFAMLFMQMSGATYPGRGDVPMLPQHRTETELLQAVQENPICRPFSAILNSMIRGEYRDTRMVLDDWRVVVYGLGMRMNPISSSSGMGFWFGGLLGVAGIALIAIAWMSFANY